MIPATRHQENQEVDHDSSGSHQHALDAPQFVARRRGVVLILVLAMLALLALIGVTFATFSGQARIAARNFARSLTRPDPNELMSFALSQLIRDTSNPLSAIRGHSLLRDMYGNDAATNGSLSARPDGRPVGPFQDAQFYVLAAGSGPTSGLRQFRTNIPAHDPAFYGYNFTRWIMRFRHRGGSSAPPRGPDL